MNSQNKNYKKRILWKLAYLAFVALFLLSFSSEIKSQPGGATQPFGDGIVAKRFFSSTVDNNNEVWFATESGIVSFNGSGWTLHNKNPKINGTEVKNLVYASSENKNELWMAGPNGATVVASPVNAESESKIYSPENSKIVGANVKAIAVGNKGFRWFGTDKGISAYKGGNWLTNDYLERYPADIFQFYPLTTMAASNSGDTLYVGTLGGGVLRYYKNDVDAVSGASEYAIWGPILMPSDTVYSVHIAADGVQWIGTAKGVGKHSGHNTLDGWTTFDSKSGLADNSVQAINSDTKGKLYFGTKNGLSIYDGKTFATYRVENGLGSNNILTIAIDKNNVVWLGTDNGVTCYKNGQFTRYK